MTRLKPILCVPDVHAPYHDQDAFDLMMAVARDLNPHAIVLIGDLLDCYSLSRFSKDPNRMANFDHEVEAGRRLLDELDSLGATEKIAIEGNHDEWLTRYVRDKAPLIESFVDDMPGILGLEERGWQWVAYRDDIKRGKVHYAHDVGFVGRYAAYRNIDSFQHSIITGHTHRLAYVVEGDATGECKLSASFGWLGDVEKVEYRHRARSRKDWALGFGVGYEDAQTGHCFWQPVPIVQYRCVVNGKLYKAPRRRKK